MIAVGVDPGTRNLALVVVKEESGKCRFLDGFRAQLSGDLTERMGAIIELLNTVFERWRPDVTACEDTYLYGRSRAIHHVSRVVGLVHAVALAHRCAIAILTPTDVKSAVAGYGRAGKDHVMRAVRMQISGLPTHLVTERGRRVDPSDHFWDAAAVTLAATTRGRWALKGDDRGRVAVFTPPAAAATG